MGVGLAAARPAPGPRFQSVERERWHRRRGVLSRRPFEFLRFAGLLLLFVSETPTTADVVKIGALFDDKARILFDGSKMLGIGAGHADAAAAAVQVINADDSILTEHNVTLKLVPIDVATLTALTWLRRMGDQSSQCFLRKYHYVKALELNRSLSNSLVGLTAAVGVSYRSVVREMCACPDSHDCATDCRLSLHSCSLDRLG